MHHHHASAVAVETIPTRLTRAQARNEALADKAAGAKDEDDVGLASWYHEAVLIAEQGKKEDKTRTNVDDGGECEDERKRSAVQGVVWCGLGWTGTDCWNDTIWAADHTQVLPAQCSVAMGSRAQ
jgi:hypothetical protein